MWYDEANNWYQILDEDSVIDTANKTVTYTTPHFSTYMIVDRTTWYDAWRQNIDYRNSSFGDTEKKNFDIAFVVDVSGSMESESRINIAKTALGNFIDSMQADDDAALITFNHYGSSRMGFTSDKEAIRKEIFQMYASGGTDVNRGLLTALSAFRWHKCDKQNIMVLICDGYVNDVMIPVDECVKTGIQIYAVNVANESSHAILKNMTVRTGGEYYYASNADQLETVFAEVIGDTTERIDPTDADGDGLYDIFETAGMRLPNGEIIFTDPTKPDSDGDSLTDYQETGIVYNVDNRYIGLGQLITVKYFLMRSYPDNEDSDSDGATDDVDNRPLMAEVIKVAKLNCKFSDYYFNVVGDGNTYYGGDQGWWRDDVTPSDADREERLEKDKYYRLCELGCGVIAMSDAELYLTLQNSGYTLSVDSPFDTDFQQTGVCKKNAYKAYIEQMYENIYPISDKNTLGLYPTKMEYRLTYFLRKNHSSQKNGSWARYGWVATDTQKQKVLDEIERMLNEDIPVVFSYHTFDKGENIILYDSVKNAKEGKRTESATEQPSHYMTITGLCKCPGEHAWDYKYILEVVSWGRIYYIDYDMYAKKLNWFSNIMSVY